MLSLEHRKKPLLSAGQFRARLFKFASAAIGLIAFSLLAGMLGYHFIAELPWIDALLNAAMILTGMGPVDQLNSDAAKLFATIYALFSGIAFLSSVGLFIVPLFHRFLHRFHLDPDDRD